MSSNRQFAVGQKIVCFPAYATALKTGFVVGGINSRSYYVGLPDRPRDHTVYHNELADEANWMEDGVFLDEMISNLVRHRISYSGLIRDMSSLLGHVKCDLTQNYDHVIRRFVPGDKVVWASIYSTSLYEYTIHSISHDLIVQLRRPDGNNFMANLDEISFSDGWELDGVFCKKFVPGMSGLVKKYEQTVIEIDKQLADLGVIE